MWVGSQSKVTLNQGRAPPPGLVPSKPPFGITMITILRPVLARHGSCTYKTLCLEVEVEE